MIRLYDLKQFQDDLKAGMTIEDALKKHQLSFQYVMKHINKVKYMEIPEPSNTTKHIGIQNGKYIVKKSFDGKMRSFGTYLTLEDALKIRECCMIDGWIQTNINRYCREHGIHRCKGKREIVDYGE